MRHDTHRFGGDWTQTKLLVLKKYLAAYTTALKNTPFKKVYIDAFAGTPYSYPDTGRLSQQDTGELLFTDLPEDAQAIREGSATIALQVDPGFDEFIFVEKNPRHCVELEALKMSFPGRANDIIVRQGEANEEILRICDTSWRSRRAVMFLDPYGMQVEWRTVEAIANTRAIDLWLLFPHAIGVNRMLTSDGKISDRWQRRLDLMFGTHAWFDEFYSKRPKADLFEDAEEFVKKPIEVIGEFYGNRLREIFPGVVQNPGVLNNSRNKPLYLLWFAASNERGSGIALKIANHLLKDIS